MEELYNKTIRELRKFTNNTDRTNEKDCKRTKNYLNWCSLKTSIVDNENNFSLSSDEQQLIKRGNVLWVNFGFNIGSEFVGGHHPAVIIRKMGDGVYVIPLDSGKVPKEKKTKDYYVDIPYVYDFPKVPRHCNIYKMTCIDYRRIDFDNIHGSVNGKTMDKISSTLKKHPIY